MNWIEVIAAAIVGAGSWMALQIVGNGKKIAVLEERADVADEMKTKLDQVAEDTAAIRVALGESPHA